MSFILTIYNFFFQHYILNIFNIINRTTASAATTSHGQSARYLRKMVIDSECLWHMLHCFTSLLWFYAYFSYATRLSRRPLGLYGDPAPIADIATLGLNFILGVRPR